MERITWTKPSRCLAIEAPPIVSLDLIHRDSVWTFDFGVDGRDAVVVGSSPEADVSIDAPGVAPLHFHFERAGDQIALVSGYGKDVRLDAVPMRGVRSVVDMSLIEFGSVSLGVRIRRIDRCVRLYSSPRGSERAAPEGADRAVFEAPTAALEVPARRADDRETAALSLRAQRVEGERPREVTRATTPEDQDFPTEEMVMRFDWDLPRERDVSEPPPSHRAPELPVSSFRVELPALEPVRGLPEDVAPRRTPEGRTSDNGALERGALERGAFERGALAARYVAGPASTDRASAGRARRFVAAAAWLEELGLLAMARPVAVTIVALVVALVSALALVGARSVMQGARSAEDEGSRRSSALEARRAFGPQYGETFRAQEARGA